MQRCKAHMGACWLEQRRNGVKSSAADVCEVQLLEEGRKTSIMAGDDEQRN